MFKGQGIAAHLIRNCLSSYMLNAAVDSKLAKKMQPLPITSVTAPFYTTVTDKLPAISQYLPPLPYFISSAKPSGAAGKKPSLLRLPSGIEVRVCLPAEPHRTDLGTLLPDVWP